MITCYYSEIKQQWSDAALAANLALLTEKMQHQAMRKRLWTDRQLTASGKLLLSKLLQDNNRKLTLSDIHYNEYHRPYFDNGLDFNIAHSGSIVICANADTGQIGIDIEEIKALDFADFTDFFTRNEWHFINDHPNKFDGFYNFWTRKEAVLKAIGSGFHTPLNSVDVSANTLVYDGISYYITPLQVHPLYKCHIATTVLPSGINLRRIDI